MNKTCPECLGIGEVFNIRTNNLSECNTCKGEKKVTKDKYNKFIDENTTFLDEKVNDINIIT